MNCGSGLPDRKKLKTVTKLTSNNSQNSANITKLLEMFASLPQH